MGWSLCQSIALSLREKKFHGKRRGGARKPPPRAKVLSRDLQISPQIVHRHTVWSIVRPGRPRQLDGQTAAFETFGRTDYVVRT